MALQELSAPHSYQLQIVKITGLTLSLLALARAVRPDAGSQLAGALGHPSVVLGDLDVVGAREVDQLLITTDAKSMALWSVRLDLFLLLGQSLPGCGIG